MTETEKTISVAFDVTPAEAWALAQFLKRVGFSEFRACAQDNDEAYAMRDAAELADSTGAKLAVCASHAAHPSGARLKGSTAL